MLNKKTLKNLALYLAIVVFITACKAGGDDTGHEYMPDMAHSVAYETYSPGPDGITSARMPAKGSIPRGYLPYAYNNTPGGYDSAGTLLKNPLPLTEAHLKEGARLYNIYCAVCHGKEGNADGSIVAGGKFPPPPSYFSPQLINLSEGKMFHSVTYGKNLMGSHASQLNQDQRWMVIHYVKSLQAAAIKKDPNLLKAAAPATATPAATGTAMPANTNTQTTGY